MPVNFIQEQKKQKHYVVVFWIVVLTSILVLWFGFFKKENPAPVSTFSYPHYSDVKIDFSVFNNDILKNLQPVERSDFFEGKKGRDNPFLPYRNMKQKGAQRSTK